MNDSYESQNFEFDPHEGQDGDSFDGSLFGSELLSPDEASRLASGPGRLVVWLGEQGTGKTSLSLELYERQRLPGAQTRFAGSWTLLAFEQRAHHRRITGAPLPAPRADLDPEGREILHLALSAGEAPVHLLVADLPGEVFRRLADNQLAAGEIPWLGRADKLAILVDGAHLCDAFARASTLTRVRQLAERLRTGGLPHARTGLALVVTKWDLVRADPPAIAYWKEREPELLNELRAMSAGAVALHASATTSPADGIAALRSWLLDIPAPAEQLEPTGWAPWASTAQQADVSSTADGVHSADMDAPASTADDPAPTEADVAASQPEPAGWSSLLPTEPTAPVDEPQPTADAASAGAAVSMDETHAAEAAAPVDQPQLTETTAPVDEPRPTADAVSVEAGVSMYEPQLTEAAAPVDQPQLTETTAPVDQPQLTETTAPADQPQAVEPEWRADEFLPADLDRPVDDAQPAESVPTPLDTQPAAGDWPAEDPRPAESLPAGEVHLAGDGTSGDDAPTAGDHAPADDSQPMDWGSPGDEPRSIAATLDAAIARLAWPEEPQRRRRWLPWRRRR